jgi:hypothetical protein
VVDDTEKGYRVLRDGGFTVSETDVLAVEIKDIPGGLYEIAKALGETDINMDYAYAFVTAKAERAMLILRVDDTKRAAQVLQAAGVRIATRQELQNI